ncbi:MAG: methyltransferase domain-containing protein [Coriobacteriia bacterium]|nr:methyltransferase domain-containing protein [Coriobacteriia bacterium]
MDESNKIAQEEANAQAPDPFTPLLTSTDWNAEWIRLQDFRRMADSVEFWDKRAPSFGSKDAPSPYILRFIELMDAEPGSTFLDMGCGNGGLAVPLAQAGHSVIAADFSRGMLNVLEQTVQAKGLQDRVSPVHMSWSDDWDAHDVGENCVDYAFASRSIATRDLEAALMKLNRAARKRCFCTLSTGASPRSDSRMLCELGLEDAIGRDWLYAFNILAVKGFEPEIAYIVSERNDSWATYDEALASMTRMVESAAMPLGEDRLQQAMAKLPAWLEAELVENPEAGTVNSHGETQCALTLRHPRQIGWAFISWNAR